MLSFFIDSMVIGILLGNETTSLGSGVALCPSP